MGWSKYANDGVRKKKIFQVIPYKKIDLGIAFLLKTKGLSNEIIAKHFGVDIATIKDALAPFKSFFDFCSKYPDLVGVVNTYENHKTTVFSLIELRLLAEIMNEEKIQKASINNLGYAFQQIFNANRLVKGLSTENIDVQSLTLELEELKEQEKILREKEKELLSVFKLDEVQSSKVKVMPDEDKVYAEKETEVIVLDEEEYLYDGKVSGEEFLSELNTLEIR